MSDSPSPLMLRAMEISRVKAERDELLVELKKWHPPHILYGHSCTTCRLIARIEGGK